MIRDLNLLGLALLTALALGATTAPMASAEEFILRSDASTTTVSGAQEGVGNNVLKTTAGTLSCEKVTYAGTMSGTEATAVELTPTYTGCAFGAGTAEIKTNGCVYRFNNGTIESSNFEGSVDIVCPAGKEIVATVKIGGVTKCTVDVPAQSGLKSITYTNVSEAPTEITADLNLSGIKYTQTAGSGFGACSTTTDETGTHESKVLMYGEAEGEGKLEKVGLSADPPGTLLTVSPVQLNFSTRKKGETTEFHIRNNHSTSRYITSTKIVNLNEEVKEEDFKVQGTTCKTEVKSEEECTVTIEFVSGTLSVFRWFRLTYKGWWWLSKTHTRKNDVGS